MKVERPAGGLAGRFCYWTILPSAGVAGWEPVETGVGGGVWTCQPLVVSTSVEVAVPLPERSAFTWGKAFWVSAAWAQPGAPEKLYW
jgi:hypothetical protein